MGSVCKFMPIYSAKYVTKDDLSSNQKGAYGILGYGPLSPLWASLIDPETNTAQYSIAIARSTSSDSMQALRAADKNDTTPAATNITLGSTDASQYATQTPLTISAKDLNDNNYTVSSLYFGIVYESSGEASSAWFENLDTTGSNDAVFDTSTQGLGLPSKLMNQFYGYLSAIDDKNVTCTNLTSSDSSNADICTMSSACSTYQSLLTSYYFRFLFDSSKSIYMSMPLATFATEVDNKCQLNIGYNNLDYITLGGMFFQEFYGQFTNTYTNGTAIQQSADIYVG